MECSDEVDVPKAAAVILGKDKDNEDIHDTTLKIELKGPKEINLTIVDIPGLVASMFLMIFSQIVAD